MTALEILCFNFLFDVEDISSEKKYILGEKQWTAFAYNGEHRVKTLWWFDFLWFWVWEVMVHSKCLTSPFMGFHGVMSEQVFE